MPLNGRKMLFACCNLKKEKEKETRNAKVGKWEEKNI